MLAHLLQTNGPPSKSSICSRLSSASRHVETWPPSQRCLLADAHPPPYLPRRQRRKATQCFGAAPFARASSRLGETASRRQSYVDRQLRRATGPRLPPREVLSTHLELPRCTCWSRRQWVPSDRLASCRRAFAGREATPRRIG